MNAAHMDEFHAGPQVAVGETMDGEARDIQFVGMPSIGGTAECPHCHDTVPLPDVDPWLLVNGQLIAGSVEAFLCPQCKNIIDVAHEKGHAGASPVVALSELHVELAARPLRYR